MLNRYVRTCVGVAALGVVLSALPVSASAAELPDGQDPALTYLLRMPLPGPATDLAVFTEEKYQRLDGAACTPTAISEESLRRIDSFYRNMLPVQFTGDPVAAAREEVVGTSEFSNETRLALCQHKSEYQQALVRQINAAGTIPVPELRPNLTDRDRFERTDRIWHTRMNALRGALSQWLPRGEV